jgi:hypothetical protein
MLQSGTFLLAAALIAASPAAAQAGGLIGPIAQPDRSNPCGCRFRTLIESRMHFPREEVLLCPRAGAAGMAQMNLLGADQRLPVLESRHRGRIAIGARWLARFGAADGTLTIRLDAKIRDLRPDKPGFRSYDGTLAVVRGSDILERVEVYGVCFC